MLNFPNRLIQVVFNNFDTESTLNLEPEKAKGHKRKNSVLFFCALISVQLGVFFALLGAPFANYNVLSQCSAMFSSTSWSQRTRWQSRQIA